MISVKAAAAASVTLAVSLATGWTAVRAQTQAPGTTICPPHVDHAGDNHEPRIVRITLYNHSRFTRADLEDLLAVTNRIWSPYGVTMTNESGPGAVAVIVTDQPTRAAGELGPIVLGTTLFTEGHATPYIKLSLLAAEMFADEGVESGLPFSARPRNQRDEMLTRILGVAFAHEMAHYLLDTSQHSSSGLLQAGLGVRDLTSPDPGRLKLTPGQERRLAREVGAASPCGDLSVE